MAKPWLEKYRWKPGQRVPGAGRKPSLAKRVRAKTDNGEEIIDTLIEIMRDKNSRDRLPATQDLADRVFGKPVNRTKAELSGSIDLHGILEMSDDEARALAERLYQELNAVAVPLLTEGEPDDKAGD